MSQPLRLTYGNSDVTFYILNKKPSFNNQQIDIMLDGENYQLRKLAGKWGTDNASEPKHGVINAIGNMIALRYRI
ncbi:hypothetical protein [Mucilaginibacter polytrichastri]|uniref:Uncharacterized protein n=1 Tax=Mucilaginibacter polytrichastri TaxID=1302689 RepID=A0A1Q5ZTF6_9SPHI|nr:hypothetical protein [Mucilaginibacter polytrichastri]OKS85054.1 hypothetical protein RG47T_0492 [Mucilaginibacter polytrichastri]SFS45272.1 hypothetical protein SAMN04487890_101586 [Mucilaginibacter polytrichastri]